MKGGFLQKMRSQLKWKILGPILVGFVLVFGVMVFLAITIASGEMHQMVENKGTTLADITTESLKIALGFEDVDSCKNSIKNLKQDKSVILAEVYDKNKKLIAQVYNISAFDERYEAAQKDAAKAKEIETDVQEKFARSYSFNINEFDKIGADGNAIHIENREIMGIGCQFFSNKIIGDNNEILGYLNVALSLENLDKAKSAITTTMAGISILALLIIGIYSSIRIGGKIKPLVGATEIMANLSEGEGDLTARINVNTNDEIGRLATNFNNFIEKLKDIVVQVIDSSSEINNGTREISAGSEDLSTRTSEQAASITETSTTLEGFTNIVKVNTENAEEVREKLENFNADLTTKRDLMENVTSTMKEIEASSKKIDNIINVINDISFQTNLLALNAAVEAARAGEAGRGFAVVASEVRNLAQKTAESSKTIQEIVTKNVESTKKGMLLVNETSQFFTAITHIMSELVSKIQEITDGSKEQSTGVEQINQAIMQLENVINQNAALVEELSATSKSMSSNTRQLNELVNRFKI